MVLATAQDRYPMQQGAKWIMPGISQRPWHDPYEHPEMESVVRAFDASHSSIKRELTEAWTARSAQFMNYEHYLSMQEDWQALYLFRNGSLVQDTATVACGYRKPMRPDEIHESRPQRDRTAGPGNDRGL